MKIALQTHKYCIETSAKKVYEKLLKSYLKKGIDAETGSQLEIQIEGLIKFLEVTDMKALRSMHRELDKGGETDVILDLDPKGNEQTLIFNGKKIKPPLKF